MRIYTTETTPHVQVTIWREDCNGSVISGAHWGRCPSTRSIDLWFVFFTRSQSFGKHNLKVLVTVDGTRTEFDTARAEEMEGSGCHYIGLLDPRASKKTKGHAISEFRLN